MSDIVRKDGRLCCWSGREDYGYWYRSTPCKKLAVMKHQPKGCVVYAYYCEEHGEILGSLEDIAQRSSQGFFYQGKGPLSRITPIREETHPPMIKEVGQAIEYIRWDDKRYPERLRSFPDAPDTLSCLGDVALLDTPSVAIVGMQRATKLGCSIASRIAAFFAQAGYTIVSGLAAGIDRAVHQGTLSVRGRAIAVLEDALGNTYPLKNRDIMQAIVRGKGLVFTSYYRHTPDPHPNGRSRPAYVQAALPLAVVPVQTAIKGGTLHICRKVQRRGGELWIPRPIEQDEREHYECYVGIRKLLTWEGAVPFASKEDYPMLLERLRNIQEKSR